MGVFDIGYVCKHGTTSYQTVKNHLAWACHDRLLRKLLPTSDGTLSYKMAFAGPQFRDPTERPNYDADPFTWDRRITINMLGDWGNEGGQPDTERRDMAGYERKAITWTLTRDKYGTYIDSGWYTWRHQVSWAQHGDWTADEYPTWGDVAAGDYPQPYQYTDCYPWEEAHGYPWCSPRIHDDWWEDNEFGFECPGCVTKVPHSFGGYPIGCAAVVVSKSGEDDELLAAATVKNEMHWRIGGRVAMRYRARVG